MCALGSYIKSLFENHGNENASPNCEVPGCHCAGKWRLAESFVSNCSMSAAGRERWQRQTTWSSVTIAQNKPLECNVAQVVARRSGLLACTAGGSKRKDILTSMCGRLRLQAAHGGSGTVRPGVRLQVAHGRCAARASTTLPRRFCARSTAQLGALLGMSSASSLATMRPV